MIEGRAKAWRIDWSVMLFRIDLCAPRGGGGERLKAKAAAKEKAMRDAAFSGENKMTVSAKRSRIRAPSQGPEARAWKRPGVEGCDGRACLCVPCRCSGQQAEPA